MVATPVTKVVVAPEVLRALREQAPVVALESTIISFGMPHPRNLQVAQEVEALVRAEGAIPATVAVINGEPRVGLNEAELELLATSREVHKAGERDLGMLAARKHHGATTVSATLALAARAGVRVFATGGMGGVHRDFHQRLDISQDLPALARYPLFLVSAGVKAILDIANTLEVLETLAIPVLGMRADKFPAFYTSRTSFSIERAESADEIARIGAAHWDMGLAQGILVANPIPRDVEMPDHEIEAQISKALKKMSTGNLEGKSRTPFLLKQLNEQTQGESLEANIHLIKNNAKVAAKIARAWSTLQRGRVAVEV